MFRTALLENELSRLNSAVWRLQKSAAAAPDLAAKLNAAINDSSLSLRWSPSSNDRAGALLIRNQNIGLIFRDSSARRVEGLVMTAGAKSPFRRLKPESALAALSLQARKSIGMKQAHKPLTGCNNVLLYYVIVSKREKV
jgi:hypothetical protein